MISGADCSTCRVASTALLVQLPSSVPTKASSPAVFAVWLRVSGERVSVQAVHDVRNVGWCLAVVQGTIRSWVPFGFPSLATRPMVNGCGCPKFLRRGHAESLSESRGAFLEDGKRAAQRLWRSIMRLLASWSEVNLLLRQVPIAAVDANPCWG